MTKAKKKKKVQTTTYQKKTRRISRWRSFKRGVVTFLRTGYYATGVVSLAVTIGAGWWWVHSGKLAMVVESSQQAVLAKTAEAGLSLQYIYLDGRKNFKKQPGDEKDKYMEQVVASLGLKPGDPILGISVDDIRERIRALSWVQDAVVERQLPNTLHIRIQERHPVAVWQNKGQLRLVDASGHIIEGERAEADKYRRLLLVVGEDAPKHTAELMRVLAAEPQLFSQIASAVRVGNRRWDIRFHNKLEVKLPARDAGRAWTELARMEREQKLMTRNVRKVDLRLTDRVFLDLPKDAGKAVAKASGARET